MTLLYEACIKFYVHVYSPNMIPAVVMIYLA